MSQKKLTKLFRLGFSLFIFLLFLFTGLEKENSLPLPVKGEPPIFYASRCKDNLRTLYIDAIESAKHSIVLSMFSLNDSKLIGALKKRAEEGVKVTVYHDGSTKQKGFLSLGPKVKTHIVPTSGLMHQKILIVDEEKLWIGSANLTTGALCFDHNLVMGFLSPECAKAIIQKAGHFSFTLEGQRIDYWSFPEKGKEGLQEIIKALSAAKHSIRVAMFTWTHPELTQAVIDAKKRGVSVEIVLDQGQGYGVGIKALKNLKKAGVFVRVNGDKRLLHHKFAWIDEELLIHGSANWTKAAFTRNHECLLFLHHLNSTQKEKIDQLWKQLLKVSELPDKQHLSILWQRPFTIFDDFLEPIGMAA